MNWKERLKRLFAPPKPPMRKIKPSQALWRFVFILGIPMTLFIFLWVGNTVYNAELVTAPKTGYATTIGVSFRFPDVPVTSYNPDAIVAFITVNTSANVGLAFVPDVPITVTIKAYTPNASIANAGTALYFTFQDAEPMNRQGQYLTSLYQYQGIKANFTTPSSSWQGKGNIWFPIEGNQPAEMSLVIGGHTYRLQQLSNFALPVQPLSVVEQTYVGQANLVLTVALLILAGVDAAFLFREAYDRGWGKESYAITYSPNDY